MRRSLSEFTFLNVYAYTFHTLKCTSTNVRTGLMVDNLILNETPPPPAFCCTRANQLELSSKTTARTFKWHWSLRSTEYGDYLVAGLISLDDKSPSTTHRYYEILSQNPILTNLYVFRISTCTFIVLPLKELLADLTPSISITIAIALIGSSGCLQTVDGVGSCGFWNDVVRIYLASVRNQKQTTTTLSAVVVNWNRGSNDLDYGHDFTTFALVHNHNVYNYRGWSSIAYRKRIPKLNKCKSSKTIFAILRKCFNFPSCMRKCALLTRLFSVAWIIIIYIIYSK